MNRHPRFALSQELEAKQTLLDQLHALATDDPDFLTDVLEGETNLLELIAALDASIIDDETLVDGANPCIGGLIRTSDECYSPGRETAVERRGRFLASWSETIRPHRAANSKDDFVDFNEDTLDGRKLLEFTEPMPSLVVSSSTRDYRDRHLDGHKRLRRETT